MKNLFVGAALVGGGALIGALFSTNDSGAAFAQFAPPVQAGDSLWHLPKFGDDGWFLHASDGRVRACNMDQVSVIGDKAGPRCSHWE